MIQFNIKNYNSHNKAIGQILPESTYFLPYVVLLQGQLLTRKGVLVQMKNMIDLR